jgi:hypothetical protein
MCKKSHNCCSKASIESISVKVLTRRLKMKAIGSCENHFEDFSLERYSL